MRQGEPRCLPACHSKSVMGRPGRSPLTLQTAQRALEPSRFTRDWIGIEPARTLGRLGNERPQGQRVIAEDCDELM